MLYEIVHHLDPHEHIWFHRWNKNVAKNQTDRKVNGTEHSFFSCSSPQFWSMKLTLIFQTNRLEIKFLSPSRHIVDFSHALEWNKTDLINNRQLKILGKEEEKEECGVPALIGVDVLVLCLFPNLQCSVVAVVGVWIQGFRRPRPVGWNRRRGFEEGADSGLHDGKGVNSEFGRRRRRLIQYLFLWFLDSGSFGAKGLPKFCSPALSFLKNN